METITGSLEGVCECLSPDKDTPEAIRGIYLQLDRLEQSLADIAGVMR